MNGYVKAFKLNIKTLNWSLSVYMMRSHYKNITLFGLR